MSLPRFVVLHSPTSDRPAELDQLSREAYPAGFSVTSFTDKITEANQNNDGLEAAVMAADELIVDANLLLAGTADALTLMSAYVNERTRRTIGIKLYRGDT